MKKILITGGNGLLGQSLRLLLSKQYEIIATGLNSDRLKNHNHNYTSLDVSNHKDCENILDAKLTAWNKKPKIYEGEFDEINPKDFKFETGKSNFMDLKEQSKHKYILKSLSVLLFMWESRWLCWQSFFSLCLKDLV